MALGEIPLEEPGEHIKMRKEPRRVLMVASAFPPTGGPGVQRTVKFVKYLPQMGWYAIVWTTESLDDLPRDDTLLADLPPEVQVCRQAYGSPVRVMRRILSRPTFEQGFWSKLARAVDWRLGAWVARGTPTNEGAAWVRASVTPICRLIEQEGIDALYSTFSPVANHLLALAVKQETGLPWVADFRDLWTDDYRYTETNEKQRTTDRGLEQRILETADVVVAVTECQTKILAGHTPTARHKFVTITNGYDPADFAEDKPRPRCEDHRFTLAHVGRFDHWRTPDVWFAGLGHFVQGLDDQDDRFELRIVGHADETTRAKIKATGVRCSYTGEVSHRQAVREMRSADALLLNVPDGRHADSVIPAKLFEYLASDRPILAVGPPDGEAERIVQSCAAGVTVNFDEEDIADGLAQLLIAWHTGQPLRGAVHERLAPYSRVHLTRKLASLLNRVVAGTERDEKVPPVPVEVGAG